MPLYDKATAFFCCNKLSCKEKQLSFSGLYEGLLLKKLITGKHESIFASKFNSVSTCDVQLCQKIVIQILHKLHKILNFKESTIFPAKSKSHHKSSAKTLEMIILIYFKLWWSFFVAEDSVKNSTKELDQRQFFDIFF